MPVIFFKFTKRLADLAHTLLKVASYDANTMSCRGLQLYMTVLMPSVEWSMEPLKPALTMIFRRMDKIFSKIYKMPSIRVPRAPLSRLLLLLLLGETRIDCNI